MEVHIGTLNLNNNTTFFTIWCDDKWRRICELIDLMNSLNIAFSFPRFCIRIFVNSSGNPDFNILTRQQLLSFRLASISVEWRPTLPSTPDKLPLIWPIKSSCVQREHEYSGRPWWVHVHSLWSTITPYSILVKSGLVGSCHAAVKKLFFYRFCMGHTSIVFRSKAIVWGVSLLCF